MLELYVPTYKWSSKTSMRHILVRQVSSFTFLPTFGYTPKMKKQHVTLTASERATLENMLAKGSLPSRTFKRATALLDLDRGKTFIDVAATLNLTTVTLAALRDKYTASGLDCLYDAPRSGRPIVIDGTQRAKVTALACSTAPQGHDRWTLRLLAEKVVEAGFCDTISHTTVGGSSKKRAEAPSLTDLVHWHSRRCLSGTHGAASSAVCPSV